VEALALSVNPLCVPCPPGWYSPDGTECLQAMPGHYTNESWQVAQIPCPPGTSNPLHGMTTCLRCNKGQFAEGAAAFCSLCPLGTYGDTLESSECKVCPEIRTTQTMGMTTLDGCICPAGTFAGPENSPCRPSYGRGRRATPCGTARRRLNPHRDALPQCSRLCKHAWSKRALICAMHHRYDNGTTTSRHDGGTPS
jgi:hypothetical protein